MVSKFIIRDGKGSTPLPEHFSFLPATSLPRKMKGDGQKNVEDANAKDAENLRQGQVPHDDLTDEQVDAMWARFPGLTFEQFFKSED